VTQIIAIANQKGGVGKTTTAVNLATCLVASGYRVLLVDLDPQANATSSIGITGVTSTLYAILCGKECDVTPTQVVGLDLIPGSIESAALERELVGFENAETIVKSFLDPLIGRYDKIIFDTPPGLGFLTINALTTADTVIIPVQTEYLALEGLALMLDTISKINPAININVLLTMYDHRLKLAKAVEQEIRSKLGENIVVYKTVIHRNVKLAEAPSFGLPIILFDPSSPGATAYIELSREVITNESDTTRSRTRAGCDPAPRSDCASSDHASKDAIAV